MMVEVCLTRVSLDYSPTPRMSWAAVATADGGCLHAFAELASEATLAALRARENGGTSSSLSASVLPSTSSNV